MELVPQANIFLKNAFHRKDLMFCKDNRKQEKIIFHINQCLHIKSSLGKFLLQYFPPEFNRFKQMSSNYLGFSLGFCLSPTLKAGKLPKKPGKLSKNPKIKQRSPIRCRGFGLGVSKFFGWCVSSVFFIYIFSCINYVTRHPNYNE